MTRDASRGNAALLLRLAREVTARHDLGDVLAQTFRSLRPLVSFGGGSIQLLDDEGWIQMAATDPAAPEHVLAERVPLAGSVAGQVILSEQPVYIPDVPAARGGGVLSPGVRSYYAVPLLADGRAIGVLQVDAPAVDAWSEAEREIFVAAAAVVAAAIQNARAHARAKAEADRTGDAGCAGEVQRLISAARRAARAGDVTEADRLLAQAERLLITGAGQGPIRMPRPAVRDVGALRT